jgi:alpha-beta hydrolase superfamily lysophospholipase
LAFFGIKLPKSKLKSHPVFSYNTVRLKTADGLMLEGWYVKAKPAQGTVILYHGHGSSKSGILAEANYFHQLGYHTFSVDFPAHGGSEGNTCNIGYTETEVAKLAYDYVLAKGEKNIVLWGISMGAATILKAVPEYELKPNKIILECPFGTLLDAVKGRIRMMHLPPTPLAEMLTFWGGVEQGYWAFDYRPAEEGRHINYPVLLHWGAHDARVTRRETDLIFQNIPSVHKQLVVFEKSGHQSFCHNEGEKWQISIKRFLAEPAK